VPEQGQQKWIVVDVVAVVVAKMLAAVVWSVASALLLHGMEKKSQKRLYVGVTKYRGVNHNMAA
jgi:hypothetical protein